MLPIELKTLVKDSVALLGSVVHRELGDLAYRRIESIRFEMTKLRAMSPKQAHEKLAETLKRFQKLTPKERFDITHAFTLMLEVMNSCENAYRTYRLKTRKPVKLKKTEAIIYVLTAHPTEARSPVNVAVFHELQLALTDVLHSDFEGHRERILNLLEIAWRLLTARARKPSVEDEAEHLYSVLLREENLSVLLTASRDLGPIYIRSWVGGDRKWRRYSLAEVSISWRAIVLSGRGKIQGLPFQRRKLSSSFLSLE